MTLVFDPPAIVHVVRWPIRILRAWEREDLVKRYAAFIAPYLERISSAEPLDAKTAARWWRS